jgi:hypothetical protein
MRLATWNLNNRVGKVRFRPEAAEAAAALDADILFITEFFPQGHETRFRATLASAGWSEQLMSAPPNEVANRVLIASKIPLAPLPLEFPTFDHQFRSNLNAVWLPSVGLAVVGVRVPAYSGQTTPLLTRAWEWLGATTTSLNAGETRSTRSACSTA